MAVGTLSLGQIEGDWIAAGGSPSMAATMAAIAMGESGGVPGKVTWNDSGIQNSYGLWMISNGTYSPPAANWADPIGNAQLAVAKLKSQGLRAWGAYTNGSYQAWLAQAQATTPIVPATQTVDPSKTTTGGTTGTGSTSPLPSWLQPGSPNFLSPGAAVQSPTNSGTAVIGDPLSEWWHGVATAWSTWWAARPLGLILAGIALLAIAVALLNNSETNVTIAAPIGGGGTKGAGANVAATAAEAAV